MGMRHAAICFAVFHLFASSVRLNAAPSDATISGKVVLKGTPSKSKPLDLSKQPECVQMRAKDPLFPETVVTSPDNSLQNVAYVSSGPAESAPAPLISAAFDQQNCHYTAHVLAVRTGEEIRIANSDPLSHNIHPMARINREWNGIQPSGVPPFSYSCDNE